nr:MAG TPA: hypothetical protein [Caudoviricetes sp.]
MQCVSIVACLLCIYKKALHRYPWRGHFCGILMRNPEIASHRVIIK